MDPFNIHKSQRGYPGREAKTKDKSTKDGQAMGVILSEGNYSDRTRTYLVNVKHDGSWTQQNAKAIGVTGSGDIPRYKAGDRVLLNFPNTGQTNQPVIVGPMHEITGQALPEVVSSTGGNRKGLPQDPNFDQAPDANVVSFDPNYLELINNPLHKLISDVELVEDRPDRTRQSAGGSEQMPSAIIGEAKEFLTQANENLKIADSQFSQIQSYRFVDKKKKLTTRNFLDIQSAKATIKKAELDLEEAEIDRQRQDEMNECLEKRNEKIEEGLENLAGNLLEGLIGEALGELNSLLPDFLQVGVSTEQGPGILNLDEIKVGPFTLNTETGTIDVEGKDNLKYAAINEGLSVLNQKLPPYLQLCLGTSGLLRVGDYGTFDLNSLLTEGEVNFDLGPFSIRDGEVALNDEIYGIANNAINELNQSLPSPLEISVSDGFSNISFGPFSLDLESGDFNLDTSVLSNFVEELSRRFFPAPFELEVSPDFETVALGPVTWDTEDGKVSVLGETIFIDKNQCKKDRVQSNPPQTESPRKEKKRDTADRSPLPTVPPLEKQTGGRNGSSEAGRTGGYQTCDGFDYLEDSFRPSIDRNRRDPFRFDTPCETTPNVILSEQAGYKNYLENNVSMEAGIVADGGFDVLCPPNDVLETNDPQPATTPSEEGDIVTEEGVDPPQVPGIPGNLEDDLIIDEQPGI